MVTKYRVKELAKQRGMTQFDLAIKSEVSMTVVQRLWQNRAPEGIRHSTLVSIATALGVPIDELTARINRESLGAVAA